MSLAVQARFDAWSLPVPVTLALVLAAFVYLRGWVHLRKVSPHAIPAWRLAAFVSGLFSLWIAVGSPLTAFDDDLLSIHMVQHVLLMAVAPPLLLLGAPALPFLHGLPKGFVQDALGPFLRWRYIARLGRILAEPVFCWLSAMIALIAWHVPTLFELGLRSEAWHEVEHASFLVTGLLFWWPVVQPWPSVARWPRWRIPLYLFLATLPCDALSAFLAFCDRVVYSSYLTGPRLFNISPLQDQECAGALMWACATFAYLIPAVVVTIQILSPPRMDPAEKAEAALHGIAGRPLPADVEVV